MAKRKRDLPLGQDFGPTVARMREIAAQGGDSLLLANGPPHPDHELLDVCGEALHFAKEAAALRAQHDAMHDGRIWTARTRAESAVLWEAWHQQEAELVQRLRRAKKLRATTPAGIYAKALAVRCSSTGAAVLARSLAEELIDCKALRESLWPTKTAEA